MVVVVSVGLGLWLGVVGAALVRCVWVSDCSVLGWVRIGGSITVRLAALQASSKRFLGIEVVGYEHPSSDRERRESRAAGGAIQTGRRREESGTGQIAGNCDDPGWIILQLREPSAEALDRMLAHAPSMPRAVG